MFTVVREELHRSAAPRVRGRQHYGATPVPAVRQHENERLQPSAARDHPVRARRQDVRHKRRKHAGHGEALDRLLGPRHPGTFFLVSTDRVSPGQSIAENEMRLPRGTLKAFAQKVSH